MGVMKSHQFLTAESGFFKKKTNNDNNNNKKHLKTIKITSHGNKKKTNNNTVNYCIVKERIVLFGPTVAIFIQQIVLDHIPHFRYRL